MGFHVGQTFGDYSVTAVLGAGGMGRVYKVEHSLTNRTEAMKVLAAELASEVEIKRFEREMRSLARLSHPNIATLHNAMHSENQLILLMEYIEGESLESMFSAGGLAHDTGIGYIKQTLLALGYAHQQGIVHRDVTPANVLITAAGEAKLTDFGLSKSYGDSLLTNCGEVLGSLPYLAPEQLKGAIQPDRRSDLYSVGAILYEHLTGQKPFGANRRLAPVLTDSESEPQPPSQIKRGLSSQWDDILRRALARDPVHRYQSAEEFLDAIVHLDQPAMADLPLPQLRTLGIAIALFATLVLALVASPAYNRFHQAALATVPWQRLHIVPPAFATAMTAPSAPSAEDTPPPFAKRRQVEHAERAVRSVHVSVLKPNPTVEVTKHPLTASPTVLTVPAHAFASTASASPAAPVASAPPPAPTDGAGQDVNQQVAPDESESRVSQSTTPAKKGFWHRLNVFKRKNADAKEKQ